MRDLHVSLLCDSVNQILLHEGERAQIFILPARIRPGLSTFQVDFLQFGGAVNLPLLQPGEIPAGLRPRIALIADPLPDFLHFT